MECAAAVDQIGTIYADGFAIGKHFLKNLADDLTRQLAALRIACSSIEQWRHNRIAHANLAVVMMEKLLDSVTIQSVHHAVSEIESIHRRVGDHFYPTEPWSFGGTDVDGDTLMFLIDAGRKAYPPFRPYPPDR